MHTQLGNPKSLGVAPFGIGASTFLQVSCDPLSPSHHFYPNGNPSENVMKHHWEFTNDIMQLMKICIPPPELIEALDIQSNYEEGTLFIYHYNPMSISIHSGTFLW